MRAGKRRKYQEKKRPKDDKVLDKSAVTLKDRQAIGDLMGKWVAYRQEVKNPVVVMTYPLLFVTPENVDKAKEQFAKSGRVLICVPYKGDGRPEFIVIG